MNLIVRGDGIHDWNKQEEETVRKGLDILSKVFLKLWW